MKIKDKILKLAIENNGSITTQDVINEGFHSEYLRLMVREGSIERSNRGQYVLTDSFVDEIETIQKRFGRGIYSHESALFLLGYTDRTPLETVMTFPRKYNITSAAKMGIKTHRVDEKLFQLGVTNTKTQYNHNVQVYSIERTLCDLMRPNCKVSIEIITDAYKQYSKQKDKNLIHLLEYAKAFHVEERVRNYMEVLL